jgi:Putative inner membrane exporter, YdcZ
VAAGAKLSIRGVVDDRLPRVGWPSFGRVDELRTGRVSWAFAEPEVMSRAVAFACTAAVGGLIALQPPANAALARHVGDLGAALISAVITVTILAVLLLVFSEPARLSGLAGFKPQYAIGGIGGAAVVAVSLVAVRSLGVAGRYRCWLPVSW